MAFLLGERVEGPTLIIIVEYSSRLHDGLQDLIAGQTRLMVSSSETFLSEFTPPIRLDPRTVLCQHCF